jgi:hypothetical protein
MLRKVILGSVVSTALIFAGAAVAKPGGGGGHGVGGAMEAHGNVNMHGSVMHGSVMHGSVMHATGVGHLNSRGPLHASSTGVLHSSGHSVLKGTTVIGGNLAGLTKGMTVVDVNGNTVGTVRGINTASGGRVVNVLVKSSTTPRTIPLSPSTLSVSGDVATTTSLRRHSKG